ncbi:fha domain protein [Stylonychia lemnae]|uniref:Fha domain protein n=1 Tax=Stylonychia lemnae TaxID=5949 RepID=A0A078B5Q0_STYLE|nr:fha domain protein [Stylonychia lemnae]|eukprot:CDW88843.1 fha domain protein [Stylonychia lemnae]
MLEYIEPFWSSKSLHDYYFEVMKEGAILEEIHLNEKPFYLVGRSKEVCDVFMENPTISRKHAIIQHKDTGDIFLYDLGSTHGTFLNKRQIPPNQYIKLKLNDLIRFGQSTRMLILNGPEEVEEEEQVDDGQPRKKIQIVSKRQNQDFLFKRRLDQLKKFHDQVNQLHDQKIQQLHGKDNEGVSWGMGFEEDEIAEYQRKQDEEGDENDDESREGNSDSDGDEDSDDDVRLLNVEVLRQRDDLTEKQVQMLNKVEGIRRQLKKLLDKKTKLKSESELEFDDKPIQGKLRGIDKKCNEMKEQLEKQEKKLKTSLKAKKNKPKKTNKDLEQETVFKYHNSDDEEDEYFDRTKYTQFNKKKQSYDQSNLQEVETYESLKLKLEQLFKQRQKITEEMQNQPSKSQGNLNQEEKDEEDELDAYMKQNEDKIRLDTQKKLGLQIVEVNKEIDKYTQLLSMVAPTNFQHKAQQIQIQEKQEELIQEKKQKPQKPSGPSLTDTMQRLKEMSELREREQEEQRKIEEQQQRLREELQIQKRIKEAQDKIMSQYQQDEDVVDDDDMGLDEDSGLRNYFKEIVNNANKNGENIDLSKYQSLIKEYDNQAQRKRQAPTLYLETEVRGNVTQKRIVQDTIGNSKQRNLNNDIEDEKLEGEVDDWIPPEDQRGDGKTSLNDKFGY